MVYKPLFKKKIIDAHYFFFFFFFIVINKQMVARKGQTELQFQQDK